MNYEIRAVKLSFILVFSFIFSSIGAITLQFAFYSREWTEEKYIGYLQRDSKWWCMDDDYYLDLEGVNYHEKGIVRQMHISAAYKNISKLKEMKIFYYM